MLHFLVLVCETIFPLAILLGTLMGFALQRQMFEVRAPAKWGAILGLVAAGILAGLKLGTGFVVREYYNLGILVWMIPLEILLVVFLFYTRKFSSEKAASPLMRCLFFLVCGAWTAYYLPDMFIFPSHFAVGVVQVVSSEFVFIVVGYLLGLLLCLLTCSFAFKVSADLPLKQIFPLNTLILLIFIIQQMITVGQILVARGILPRADWLLDLIIFLLNNSRLVVISLTVLSALVAVLLWINASRTAVNGENPALRRKSRHLILVRIRRSRIHMFLLLVGVLVSTVGYYYDNKKVELSPPMSVTEVDGEIRVTLDQVNDGHLHRFVWHSPSGVSIRYIIIRKSETSYGVGLDACDVCGTGGGYYERKGQVVCILCDVVMNKSTIGFAGGCNPVPLPFTIREGCLIIKTEDLEAEEDRFY